MISVAPVEQRLSAVEAAIAEIQARLAPLAAPPADWLSVLIGSQKDEPAFDEVVALGRVYRGGGDPVGDGL